MIQYYKQFLKRYKKYVITFAVLLAVTVTAVLGVRFYNTPKDVTVEDNLSDAFADSQDKSSLTINGTAEGVSYNWFYDKNSITSSDRTDLKIQIVHDYDEVVKETLNASYVLGYQFASQIVLNGRPQLTLLLPDCTVKDLVIYHLNGNTIERYTTPAINLEGSICSVTYVVTDTEGTYFAVGGFSNVSRQVCSTDEAGTAPHNTGLQGINASKDSSSQNNSPGSGKGNSPDASGQQSKKDSSGKKKKTEKQDAGTQSTGTQNTSQPASASNSSSSDGNSSSASNKDSSLTYVTDQESPGTKTPLLKVVKRTLSDGTQSGKDEWLTDPVPEGKPLPVNPEDSSIDYNKTNTCTLSIKCSTILEDPNALKQIKENGKEKYVPSDGTIYKKKEVIFYDGESVFDVLAREVQKENIQMEYSFTAIYNSVYIEGIQNLYEFDGGDLSGWMYKVNGWFPNYGASRYLLQQGDDIVWCYTCDLGKDVGCDWDLTQ